MTSCEASRLGELAREARGQGGRVVFLTGAGISAESGIPTFRGPEGYWTVGSRNYRAEELGTRAAFRQMPEEVWAWYLYRRGVCRAAEPNAAHRAIVDVERALGEDLWVITQNVDGLHRRAGTSPERLFEIHGNIDFLRCEDEHPRLRPIPDTIDVSWDKTRRLTEEERRTLRCCAGERWSRPHVLWFDERYDEALFRFESSLRAAFEASMLIVVGTSGATTLPSHIVSIAAQRRIPVICINADPSPFTEIAASLPRGLVFFGRACDYVPLVARVIAEAWRQ